MKNAMDRKIKLPEDNLNIDADMAFINNILKLENIKVEQDVRPLLLDLLYSITNDCLTEAKFFTNLTIRPHVEGEDFRLGRLKGHYRLIRRPTPKQRPPVEIQIPKKRIRYTRLSSSKPARFVKPATPKMKRRGSFKKR